MSSSISSMFTPEQRGHLRRLEAAWLQGGFDGVGEVLDAIGASRPAGAWAPRPCDLPDPRLRRMHEVWSGHRARRPAGCELPHVSQCRIEDYGAAADVMMVLRFWPDRSDLDYLHYGAELARHAGGSQTGLTVGRLAHHAPYSLVFASTYYAAAHARSTHYSELVSAPALVSTTWCRYLLPYVDDDGDVVAFACGNVPVPGVPTWPPVADGRHAAGAGRAASAPMAGPEAQARLTRLERDVRELLESSPLATMIISLGTGRCYFTNAPMDCLLDFEHEALNLADPFSHFADPAQYHRVLDAAGQGLPVRDVEVRLVSRSGRTLWVQLSATSIEFDSHACVALWFYDVTARKHVEQDLQRALAQAEHARGELSRTLAYVGHDLRAPLATIAGYARLMDAGASAAQRDLIEVISRSVHYQMLLIDELLEVARGELQPMQLHMQPLDLDRVLEDIADYAVVLSAQQRNRFRYVRSPWWPAAVLQDRQRLQQVLLNVVANAAKFTHEGDIELRAWAEPLDEARCRLDVSVSDTGIGIAQADQARIFEAFEQARSPRRGGTGLGLYIARRILRHMGSELALQSRLGAGSSFSFSLELHLAPADAVPAEPEPPALPHLPQPARAAPEAIAQRPPREACLELDGLAAQGRFTDIRDWVARARADHAGCGPFLEAVGAALDRLDFEAIRRLASADRT